MSGGGGRLLPRCYATSRFDARGKQTGGAAAAHLPYLIAQLHARIIASDTLFTSIPPAYTPRQDQLLTANFTVGSQRFSPEKAHGSAKLGTKAVVGRGGWFPASTIFLELE